MAPATHSARALQWSLRTFPALAPAAAVALLLFALGIFGPRHPAAWLMGAPVLLATLVLTLRHAPVLIFWAVPVSISWHFYMPLLHYEAAVLLIAFVLALAALPRTRIAGLRLDPVEWRFGLFLLTTLPGLVNATSLWRFGGAVKVLVVGLLSFEVARWGARRFGWRAMLWGPALFCALASAMLFHRVAESGVPLFKSAAVKAYLSTLPWGTSNYVAAVLVLCLPSLVMLVRARQSGTPARALALIVTASLLASLLLTNSRGGLLIAVGYLLTATMRAPRWNLWALGVLWLVVVAMAVTPPGQALLARTLGGSDTGSISFRFQIWEAAIHRGVANLPFGLGAGQGLIQDDTLKTIDPHNYLLTLFSELGPLGLAAWLWVFWTLWALSRRMRASPSTRLEGQALAGTLAVALVNGLFEPTLPGNPYQLLFWWLVGVHAAAAGPIERPERRPFPSQPDTARECDPSGILPCTPETPR